MRRNGRCISPIRHRLRAGFYKVCRWRKSHERPLHRRTGPGSPGTPRLRAALAAPPVARLWPPVSEAARRRQAKAERELHVGIIHELTRRGIAYVRARMDKRSPLPGGWPDFSIYPPGGGVLFVEVKTDEGRLSAEQERCHQDLAVAGYPHGRSAIPDTRSRRGRAMYGIKASAVQAQQRPTRLCGLLV